MLCRKGSVEEDKPVQEHWLGSCRHVALSSRVQALEGENEDQQDLCRRWSWLTSGLSHLTGMLIWS